MNFPEQIPQLATERLLLRETLPADVDAVFAMESDPVAMRYWSRAPMTDIAQARDSIERAMGYFAARQAIRWSIVRRVDRVFLGHVSLFHFDEQNGRAEIGYGLARPYWKQGYMREALAVVIDYAFGRLGLRRLEADTDPRNDASLRALERLGFAREGLLRERWQVGGEISDSALLGLLAREWRPRAGG